MDALDKSAKVAKKLGNMTPASELPLFDTGGYLMNKAKWKNKEERRNRKAYTNVSVVIKARNRAGQDKKNYKPVKLKEL